jgi:hypothetical protein
VNTEPNTFTFPYLNHDKVVQVKRIPREFEVEIIFSVTCKVKVMAESRDDAEVMVSRHGEGEWEPKKEWDMTDGDIDTVPAYDDDNLFYRLKRVL